MYHRSVGRDETLRAILACAIIIVMVISVCGLMVRTRDPLIQIRIPAKEISIVSLAFREANRLVVSDTPNIHHRRQFECRTFDLEEAAKVRGKLLTLPEEFNQQSNPSSLHFYISATPARSHLPLLFHSSRVSSLSYSQIITSITIIATTTILFLLCCNNFGKAVKKLLKLVA